MPHEPQERYSALVLAKLRKDLKLKDGVVFNNDYEGNPTAGAVKIPVRDTEVPVSDYDKANGIKGSHGSTGYETVVISKDKAINEIIDGYDAAAVPDKIVAERLSSGTYSLAVAMDTDGGSALLAGSTPTGVEQLTKDNIYGVIVDIRKEMNKANIPNDGKRYLLVTPDAEALILKSPEFISASSLGDEVKETGALGKIAGFNVIPWNDDTANLQMIAGHPRFATRIKEFAVKPHVQSLDGSGNYIGACAVQGRQVYDHKVLRSVAIRAVYSPKLLYASAAPGGTANTTVVTVTGAEGNLFYRVNPALRAKFGESTDDSFAALTSGDTKIAAVKDAVIEIVEVGGDGTVVASGYAHAVVK